MSRSTSRSPKRLEIPTTSRTFVTSLMTLPPCRGEAIDGVHAGLDHQTQPPIEEHRGDESRERNVTPRLDRSRRMGQLRQRDDGEKGAVLDDLDHLVADHRP